MTTNNNGTFADLKDENGQIVGRCLYDKNDQITAELIMKRGASLPSVGDTITISSAKYLCEGVTVTAENENFTQLSLTLTKYEGLTLA